MTLIADSFSSQDRPVLRGRLGAVSAAHPFAVAAGQEILSSGGTAADAAIAAQAVLCVIMPNACGLGGDMLALVHAPSRALRRSIGAPEAGQESFAINGAGAAPLALDAAAIDGPNSITVPGIVDAWVRLSQRCGQLPLSRVLEPAIRLAHAGMRVSSSLAAALIAQRPRLQRGRCGGWVLFDQPTGALLRQPELASLLERIAAEGRSAFYYGPSAVAIEQAVQALGGVLSQEDLAAHQTIVAPPVESTWGTMRIATQPPMTQGILLNMAAQALSALGDFSVDLNDHAAVEATEAAFAFRADVSQGAALLAHELPIDLTRASLRGGPRAYLHTAGVATADAQGMVISSLVSVFDDFGSCVFVPQLGITLNNRAGGFTHGANAAAPGKRPVHTLAPAMLMTPQGPVALATPGADGQVQTLLQILIAIQREGMELARAIAKPRWRSENGLLLIEQSHEGIERLAQFGHRVTALPDGEMRFGAVVCAGYVDDEPIAAADWRRETAAGVA